MAPQGCERRSQGPHPGARAGSSSVRTQGLIDAMFIGVDLEVVCLLPGLSVLHRDQLGALVGGVGRCWDRRPLSHNRRQRGSLQSWSPRLSVPRSS